MAAAGGTGTKPGMQTERVWILGPLASAKNISLPGRVEKARECFMVCLFACQCQGSLDGESLKNAWKYKEVGGEIAHNPISQE